MKFSLTELRVHKIIRKSDRFDPTLLLGPAPDLVSYIAPISADVQAELVQSEILISGFVNGEIRQTCSRCLTNFNQAIRGKIRQNVDLIQETIDVDEFVKESVLLDLPLRALCRADCKGLCPVCGGNKNEIECACVPADPSNPWKILKDFKTN